MSELKDVIEKVLKDTFYEIYYAYKEHKEDTKNENTKNENTKNENTKNENTKNSKSHIVFPKYKNNEEIRVSEQELRFVFVEKLNQNICDDNKYYYSVETPTGKSYVFDEDNGGPKVVSQTDEEKNENNKGVSARIDLVIMAKDAGNFKRVALIEFKAHNPDVNDYRKDICKLINEEWEDNPNCLKYFIQIINVNNEHRTWGNIENKKITAIDALREEDKGDKEKEKRKKDIKYSIEYKCFNLNSKNIMYGIIKNDKLENIDYDTIDTECK